MRVIIEADLFQPKNLNDDRHADLLALFQLGKQGVHTVEIEPGNDVGFRAWLKLESERTQRMCEFAINQGRKHQARRKRRKLTVAAIAAPSWKDLKCPLDVAVRLLQRPLVLLLENARNDRNFLQALTQLHADFNLEDRVAKRHIDVQTKGGSDNKKWLDDPHRTPEELARLWVLSDSDARHPWREGSSQSPQHISSSVQDLADTCHKRNVPLHILTRRSIENYLPLPTLLAWSAEDRVLPEKRKRETTYEAFSKLVPRQRHHYNMKAGILEDGADPMHEAKMGDLYDDVPHEVAMALAHGFGSDIASRFENGIRTNWLRNDNQEKEALQIVESILEHL